MKALLLLWVGPLMASLGGCGDDGSGSANNASSGDIPASTSGPTAATNTTGDGGPPDDTTTAGPSDPDSGTDSLDTDGLDTDDPDPSAGSSGGDPPPGDPVTVAVGYGGMRARSLDDGLTWQDYVQIAPAGGDDMDLLRGAAWGEGRFVAVGWRIYSSPDGVTWTEHDNPTGQWYGAVAHGNDQFLAVGGGGYCARSDDGQAWQACTDATDGPGFTHVRSVLFLDGLFFTADANGVLRSSPDGEAWTVEDAGFGTPWIAIDDGLIVAAAQTAPAQFATKRLRGGPSTPRGATLERAEPGTEAWTPVFVVPEGNRVFQAHRFAVAEGWVPRPG